MADVTRHGRVLPTPDDTRIAELTSSWTSEPWAWDGKRSAWLAPFPLAEKDWL